MRTIIIATSLIALAAGTTAAAVPVLQEQRMARAEERLILKSPIAGIHNSRWYDYRNDIGEARKELASDLRRASDLEDHRDAWEEYAHELRHERIEYIDHMAERGYRDGRVIVG